MSDDHTDPRVPRFLASQPAPEFPAGFTARVVALHRQRAREAAVVTRGVVALSGLAVAACVLIVFPALSVEHAKEAARILADSHAAGAIVAALVAAGLGNVVTPARPRPPAT